MFLNINFEEVPDTFEPVKPGIYTCMIEDVKVGPSKSGKSQRLEVFLVIDNEGGEEHGRKMKDYISLDYPTSLKQIMYSAGLNPSDAGVDTEDLIGATVRACVKSRTYTDKDTGEVKETSSISEYIWDK